MNNNPQGLELMRKASQDKLYSRNPQLVKRLEPFMEKANKVKRNPIKNSEPLNGTKKELEKKTKFDVSKVSEVPKNVLWGMS